MAEGSISVRVLAVDSNRDQDFVSADSHSFSALANPIAYAQSKYTSRAKRYENRLSFFSFCGHSGIALYIDRKYFRGTRHWRQDPT